MPARPSLLRAAVVLSALAAAALSCGRDHDQVEGVYQFTAGDALRDDCGRLAESKDLSQGELILAGDIVAIQMHDGLYDTRLKGAYLSGVEQFSVDGTVGNLTESVRGVDCFLDLVSIHLDATTASATEFHGTLRLRYEALDRESCTCEVRAPYRAVRL